MPELPDLQVFSQNLTRHLAGKKLGKLVINKRAKINSSVTAMKKALEGATLSKVYREGKELRFAFRNKHILGIHLMLRGKLQWLEEETAPKNMLVEFHFDNKNLALTDFQYNARLTLNPATSDIPDALSAKAGIKFWKQALNSKAQVKNILLDQHVVRGIGNAYADEILWDARISPFSKAAAIPGKRIEKLIRSIKRVLKNAEKRVKKADPKIIGGEIRDFLVVHNSRKKKTPSGATIKTKQGSGRKTYYTDEQQLFK
jgi:formamidopyrimidine-DNA glycosylase